MATYSTFSVVVSNAAVTEIGKRLRESSEGEGFVTTIRRENGLNTICAEFSSQWLPESADSAWVDALQAWIDNDGSAVSVSRQNVLKLLAD